MANCAVSVIIPMYNAEKYIRQCLISVLASKFTDYEVIVVNNCSTDNSLAEVKKLLPHFDGRLKILSTKKNSGSASVPRNVGIKNAAGNYVTFIDSDDFIMPKALGDFFELAEKFQADVVHTEKWSVFLDKGEATFKREELVIESLEPHDKFVDEPTLESNDLGERVNRYLRGKFFWLPWSKFYRRDFLIKNKIDFPQIKFSEDMVFCFKCMCLAENYLRVPNVTNIHRIRKDSASKGFDLRTWLIVTTKVINLIEDFMSRENFFKSNPNVHHAILKFFIDKAFSFIANAAKKSVPYELYKVFYDELQNPALNSKGKNLIAAYLYTEKAMNQTR